MSFRAFFSYSEHSFLVIPSASEESIMDASLRLAPFSMTTAFRAQARNPKRTVIYESIRLTLILLYS